MLPIVVAVFTAVVLLSGLVKHFAEEGKGNVIFLDGSVEGMQRQLRAVSALGQLGKLGVVPGGPPTNPPNGR